MGYYQAGDYYQAGFDWGGFGKTLLSGAVDVAGQLAPQWLDRGARAVSGLGGAAPPFAMTPGGQAAAASAGPRLARAGRVGGYRRMNPGNFRALRRSMRRLKSFEKAARQVYHFVKPAARTSRFKFPKRRK